MSARIVATPARVGQSTGSRHLVAERGAELSPRAGSPAVTFSSRTRDVSRTLMIVLAVIVVAESIAFAGTYLLYSRYRVVTDNAVVDADPIDVNAPQAGTLRRWSLNEGSRIRPGEHLGRVVSAGSKPQILELVRAPRAGTVGLNNVTDGEYVEAGQTLAIAYDLDHVWITARIDESDIARVRLGQLVDIRLDGYPNVAMVGKVGLIQASTASQLTVYPSTDSDPTNVQKIDQYVAVRILPTFTGGMTLRPGMNATVHIRL